MIVRYYYGLFIFLMSMQLVAQPLFDSHLHYTAEDARRYTPEIILKKLDSNDIPYAVVIGTPAEYATRLYQFAPERIIPVLSIYRESSDKQTWTNDKTLLPYFEKQLEDDYWGGIGELHIFANDRYSKVFERVITLAAEKKLPLLMHADPVVIDRVFELAPGQIVIWAHAGTYPYADLVADYLKRYPNLSIDVSMRDKRIAPDNMIDDDWYELFVTYPDRIMVGVDTNSKSRWNTFNSAVSTIRNWLEQLPDEVAVKLAYVNAAKVYKKSANENDKKDK